MDKEPIKGIKKFFVKETKWEGPQIRSWVWLIVVVAISTAVIGGLFALSDYTSHKGCRAKAASMDRDHKYGQFMGCLIQLEDGTYIPIENYKVEAKEGIK